MRFSFVSGDNAHRMSVAGSEVCRNMTPERRPDGQLVLVQRPGLDARGNTNTGARRAEFEHNGRAFFITGGSLYEITAAGTLLERSNTDQLGNDGLPASIAGNGDQGGQLCIISAEAGFIYDLAAGTLTAITDPQFPARPLMVVYLNGHFIVISKDGFTFALSAQYDGLSYIAADIGEKSKTIDFIQSAMVDEDSGELWLIGTRLAEVWQYTGTAGFPLDPVNTIVAIGGAAPFGGTRLGGRMYWLGQSKDGDRVFVRSAGYGYERISTHAVEQAIQGYSNEDLAACEAFAFEMGGHRFVIFTFIDAGATWVYDEATSLWAEWDHWDSDALESQPFLGIGHIFAFGQHLVGSHLDGTIYQVSFDYADDAGDVIRRVARGPRIHAEGKRIIHHRVAIDCEVGVGDATTPAPVLLLRFSDDKGRTFSSEYQVSLGAAGDNDLPVEVRNLGLAGFHGRIYEVVITDPVITAIGDVYVDLGRAA